MNTYELSRIYETDKKSLMQLDLLLEQEGIERDRNLDYMLGMFDEDYHLVAAGSCFLNTLRCLVVDSAHQGEGLLNQIITHLMEYQFQRGYSHLFLYTKCNTSRFFEDLGFHEIARVENQVIFMENHPNGFKTYVSQLKRSKKSGHSIASIIVNANPFTLGHQYLIEKAAKENDYLHIFVVSEDISLIPFQTRFYLVKEGTKHLKNIIYHETGNYMISSATFPSYFLKDSDKVIEAHAKLDIQIFKEIAASLGITKRYVGEEPYSQVTSIYNRIMAEELSTSGISCLIIPRKEENGSVISASNVRQLIHDGNLNEIKCFVPVSTYEFFLTEEGESVIQNIQHAAEVIHY